MHLAKISHNTYDVSVVTELEEGNASCRREAAWVFLNMCECGYKSQESIIPDIVRNGGISAVCQNLYKDNDAGRSGWLIDRYVM